MADDSNRSSSAYASSLAAGCHVQNWLASLTILQEKENAACRLVESTQDQRKPLERCCPVVKVLMREPVHDLLPRGCTRARPERSVNKPKTSESDNPVIGYLTRGPRWKYVAIHCLQYAL
ncbi:hypothetical protein BaRGS_00020888 [Batillaria attramentaria]|uniref:Uncharacterized protein n=1 Tax=Batillaria attramentaria TaxID=370345 RepID=A0ABD0KKT3_9CAEN